MTAQMCYNAVKRQTCRQFNVLYAACVILQPHSRQQFDARGFFLFLGKERKTMKLTTISFRATDAHRAKLAQLAIGERTTVTEILLSLIEHAPVKPTRIVYDALALDHGNTVDNHAYSQN